MTDFQPRILVREYQCQNPSCERFRESYTFTAQPHGPFYVWPDVRCICSTEPVVVAATDAWGTWMASPVAPRI